jgi:predicted ester cyclase
MTSEERNKALTLRGFEEMFNKGDLSVVDELVAAGGSDHQEAPGTDFAEHLKDVITKMRAAFPDLRFEVHHILAERDMVASRSTMTGTHEGRFEIGPFRDIPPTGRQVEVPHMHFFRWVDGKNTDLWHVWDTPALMRQLGAPPQRTPQREGASV